MSIVVRTIHGKQYAYDSHREGRQTRQTYLGPMTDADVHARVASALEAKALPARVRRLFWDSDPAMIDLHRNQDAVIERVLEFGDLQDVRWVQTRYPGSTVARVLVSSKGLSERSRSFWKLWFRLEQADAR